MIIRQAQIEQLGLAAESRFVSELAVSLANKFPDWMPCSTTEEQEAWVRKAMAYGRFHRITGSPALRSFIACIAGRSLPIPFPPAVEAALHIPSLSEEARVEELFLLLAGERHKLISLQL